MLRPTMSRVVNMLLPGTSSGNRYFKAKLFGPDWNYKDITNSLLSEETLHHHRQEVIARKKSQCDSKPILAPEFIHCSLENATLVQ
ncbi:hypothetical protein Pint_11874 [Pistacia integerrima]|uniref:Uncharacterized protein n=1 Tax=Pistacia integerrima TaxID=434235 RepID=A0ACC0XJN8_9ROSI|nr:hypothetical protein Pint_11874 [Pistacia integerrima]